MVKKYLAWQQKMGDNITGFSAYCMRQLGQLRELDLNYGVLSDTNSKVCNDWSLYRWQGGGVYWHDGNELPISNSWEYYFENEIGVGDNDFILSTGEYTDRCVPTPGTKNFRDKNEIEIFGALTERYFKPKQNVIDSLNPTITDKKTLGVHIRRSTMGLGHPHAYLGWSDEVYFEKVMGVFNKGNFDKLYVATEEYSIYNYFRERVPDILLGIDECYRVSSTEILETSLSNKSIRQFHAYFSGLEVLVDTINLSRCDSMLCFISGVSSMACFFNNNKFNEVYYFDEL